MRMLVETCSYVAGRDTQDGDNKEVTDLILGKEVDVIKSHPLFSDLMILLKTRFDGSWIVHGTVLCVDDEGFPL